MLKTALKPRWIAGLVFALLLSGVFVLLSQWQFGRSTQAEAPVSTTTEDPRELTSVLQPGGFFPGSVADQIVSATGSYDPQKQVLVPGRLNDGAKGYWIVASDGGVFSFDAKFAGSTGNIALSQPVVGIAADPDGVGYWMAARDGGLFAFDAKFNGSNGATPFPIGSNRSTIAIAATP